MTPEIALLIRAVLLSVLLVGIEYVSKRHRLRRARSKWLSPVVRLQSAEINPVKINPVQLSSVQARPVQVNPAQLSPVPLNPVRVQPQVVRLEPRQKVSAHVFVKRAA